MIRRKRRSKPNTIPVDMVYMGDKYFTPMIFFLVNGKGYSYVHGVPVSQWERTKDILSYVKRNSRINTCGHCVGLVRYDGRKFTCPICGEIINAANSVGSPQSAYLAHAIEESLHVTSDEYIPPSCPADIINGSICK